MVDIGYRMRTRANMFIFVPVQYYNQMVVLFDKFHSAIKMALSSNVELLI